MTIGERIKALRKEMGLTQEKFSARIHTSRSNLGNVETNTFAVTDRMMDDICREFHVNRQWLEFGEGEMLTSIDREEKIFRFIREALDDQSDSFKRRLLNILVDLDTEGWQKLKDTATLMSKLVNEKEDE